MRPAIGHVGPGENGLNGAAAREGAHRVHQGVTAGLSVLPDRRTRARGRRAAMSGSVLAYSNSASSAKWSANGQQRRKGQVRGLRVVYD